MSKTNIISVMSNVALQFNLNSYGIFCRYADELSVADEVLIRKNDDDELTPAMIINVTTLLMAGTCSLTTYSLFLLISNRPSGCGNT